MGKRVFWGFALIVTAHVLVALGCRGSSDSAAGNPAVGAVPVAPLAPAPVAPPAPAAPSLRGGGHFVAWIQQQKAIYRSDDGRTWTRVPGESTLPYSWAPWLAADGSGALYTASISDKPEVNTSPNGLTWAPVPTTATSGERMSWALCAGGRNELFAITSTARTFHSMDGGHTWVEKTRAAPQGAKGSGGGFEGSCAFSADGSKLVVQGWYFSGPVLSVSMDKGATWTAVPPPVERGDARTVLWAQDALIFAHYDRVFRTSTNGQSWEPATPAPLYAPGETTHGYNRWFASDGANVVVGLETPGAGTEGEAHYHGAVFYSNDAGRTFQVLPFPYNGDPTPTVSDELVRIAFVPGSP